MKSWKMGWWIDTAQFCNYWKLWSCHRNDWNVPILFLPYFHFICLRFLAYQDANCIWRGLGGCKGCISSFFWLPSLAPRGKKEKTKPHLRAVYCSELFRLLPEGCGVEGRAASSLCWGLLRDIWDGGWAVSWRGRIKVAYLQMNLRGRLGSSLTMASCFAKLSCCCCDRRGTATCCGHVASAVNSPCCTPALRM